MLISAALARTRTSQYVDDTQYTDANALIDINRRIREAVLYFKNNWDIGKGGLVASQEEYRVEELDDTPEDVEIINVNKVWVNY